MDISIEISKLIRSRHRAGVRAPDIVRAGSITARGRSVQCEIVYILAIHFEESHVGLARTARLVAHIPDPWTKLQRPDPAELREGGRMVTTVGAVQVIGGSLTAGPKIDVRARGSDSKLR